VNINTTKKHIFHPRILIIDDEKRIREGCHKVLTEEGFDVALAEDGNRGIEMIEKDHYDIILLDLMMPGLSGFDVLGHVKGLHPDTVIIVISGYATVEHSIESMKKGAFDFIPKPFAPDQLRLIVYKAMEYTRTLQDIAHEKSRIRVLVNQLDSGVMAVDMNKRVALANPAFLKMMRYHGAQVIGRSVADCVRDDRLLVMIDQALAMPEDRFVELTGELDFEARGDEQEIVLGARCVPFRDRLGRNLGALTLLHDITALKKMDRIKSNFVSMVAHEIKSPMNSVLAQLKVLQDGLAGEVTEKQKEILDRASKRIIVLTDLSSELLDLAKIESGLITQEKEALDMAMLIADQIAFHDAKAQEKNIHLKSAPLPKLPSVVANRPNMEEVLSNLITNAIHYTPEGGRVTVSARVEGHYLRISVQDTGIGIDKKDLNQIFNRFYRVKSEKTMFITGTGLGLPIVKSILEAHNGRVRVESALDQGSTFHFYLPLTED
jgi:two-component system, OmpR family, phosphate regulon sensor histidine kinase PhoR